MRKNGAQLERHFLHIELTTRLREFISRDVQKSFVQFQHDGLVLKHLIKSVRFLFVQVTTGFASPLPTAFKRSAVTPRAHQIVTYCTSTFFRKFLIIFI